MVHENRKLKARIEIEEKSNEKKDEKMRNIEFYGLIAKYWMSFLSI